MCLYTHLWKKTTLFMYLVHFIQIDILRDLMQKNIHLLRIRFVIRYIMRAHTHSRVYSIYEYLYDWMRTAVLNSISLVQGNITSSFVLCKYLLLVYLNMCSSGLKKYSIIQRTYTNIDLHLSAGCCMIS